VLTGQNTRLKFRSYPTRQKTGTPEILQERIYRTLLPARLISSELHLVESDYVVVGNLALLYRLTNLS